LSGTLQQNSDEIHTRRMEANGHGYHYDSSEVDPHGSSYRVIGRFYGDWNQEKEIARSESVQEDWNDNDAIDVCYLTEGMPVLNKMVQEFDFSRLLSTRVQIQYPGNTVTRHVDEYSRKLDEHERAIRVLVPLEDWESGQHACFGNTGCQGWKAGDIIFSDYELIPHSTSNSGWNYRSVLLITGVVTDSTIKKLAFGMGDIYL